MAYTHDDGTATSTLLCSPVSSAQPKVSPSPDILRAWREVTYHDNLTIYGFEMTVNNWDSQTRLLQCGRRKPLPTFQG